MAKCKNCGTSGGLLKLSENGFCKKCEKKIIIEGSIVRKNNSPPILQILDFISMNSDLLIEEIEVLIKFLKPLPKEDLVSLYWKKEWENISKVQLSSVIEKLISERYIKSPSLEIALNHLFSLQEMKEFCKLKELKSSGKKSELIQRLITNDEDGMRLAIKENNLFICSEKGKKLSEEYINKRKEERELAENTIIKSLEKRNFKSAIRTKILYQSNQFFNRGLGFEFLKDEEKQYIPLFERIFSDTPSILKDLPENKLSQFRVLACFDHLWNFSINHLISSQERISERYSNKGVINLLFSYSSNMMELERIIRDYKDSTLEAQKNYRLRIYTCNDEHVCEECKKIASRKYKPGGKIPEIPNPLCTCLDGCRCYYSEDIDF